MPTQNISLASSHVDVYQRAGAGDLDSRDIAQWMRDTGEDIDRWAGLAAARRDTDTWPGAGTT